MSRASGGRAFGSTPPAWMEAMRDRAGPLLGVALRFADEAGQSPFPSGHDGIRRLAKLVEEAAYDTELDDVGDARFVEGAGAMLGLLLLGHVGLGRHVERAGQHRIDLGEHGFFDPFGAIDASLDADEPTAELRRRITAAEAEAAGDGPVARTRRAFAAALARSGHPAKVRDRFGPWVALDDGVEIDLARFVAMADAESSDLEGSVSRLVALLLARGGDDAIAPFPEIASRLLPRIAPQRFFAELEVDPSRKRLARRPLVADLSVALVVASEGRLRFVREDEVERWRSAGHDPFEVACSALDARSRDTRFLPMPLGEGGGLVATRGDGLAATVVLAPQLVAALVQRHPEGCVVAMPHRDELLVFPSDVDLELLARTVLDRHARAPHGVSSRLFALAPDGALAPLEIAAGTPSAAEDEVS